MKRVHLYSPPVGRNYQFTLVCSSGVCVLMVACGHALTGYYRVNWSFSDLRCSWSQHLLHNCLSWNKKNSLYVLLFIQYCIHFTNYAMLCLCWLLGCAYNCVKGLKLSSSQFGKVMEILLWHSKSQPSWHFMQFLFWVLKMLHFLSEHTVLRCDVEETANK